MQVTSPLKKSTVALPINSGTSLIGTEYANVVDVDITKTKVADNNNFCILFCFSFIGLDIVLVLLGLCETHFLAADKNNYLNTYT